MMYTSIKKTRSLLLVLEIEKAGGLGQVDILNGWQSAWKPGALLVAGWDTTPQCTADTFLIQL